MDFKTLCVIFSLISCLTVVYCDNVEDAIRRGVVSTYMLRRTKMDPITVNKDSGAASLEIFCYEGVNSVALERMKRVFSTGKLHINTTGEDYQLFSGQNQSSVYEAYTKSRETWLAWRKVFPWQSQSVPVPPFNLTCIGVSASQQYAVIFVRQLVDPWLLLAFFMGLILFYAAEKLSKNILFYYGTGVSVGLLASLLILVFIMSRFMPLKKGVYAFLLGGWAVVGWAVVQLWGNMTDLVQDHVHYVIAYLVGVGLLSFAVCYYRGPVTDPRSLNLIKWTIQLLAVSAVFMSMQVEEAAATVIVLMIAVYNFPRGLMSSWTYAYRRRFPKKRRLLTQEEYEQQADENTRKALEELREYCRSPNCDAWKTISRIGTPQRSASYAQSLCRQLSRDSDVAKCSREVYQSVCEAYRFRNLPALHCKHCSPRRRDPPPLCTPRMAYSKKFAKWVEGDSHLSDSEIDLYDSSPQPSFAPEVTDDEDEIDFRLNSQ